MSVSCEVQRFCQLRLCVCAVVDHEQRRIDGVADNLTSEQGSLLLDLMELLEEGGVRCSATPCASSAEIASIVD